MTTAGDDTDYANAHRYVAEEYVIDIARRIASGELSHEAAEVLINLAAERRGEDKMSALDADIDECPARLNDPHR